MVKQLWWLYVYHIFGTRIPQNVCILSQGRGKPLTFEPNALVFIVPAKQRPNLMHILQSW